MKDIVIVGGGIVGLATAYTLKKANPKLSISLLEKEKAPATHQTGNNSGVIHSGLYYKPGSLKAKNCIDGYSKMITFCDENEIPYEICGKLVIATKNSELPYLDTLYERGTANGLKGLTSVPGEALAEYEPHVKGIRGLHVPQAGITDYKKVAAKMSELFEKMGGLIEYNHKVINLIQKQGHIHVETTQKTIETKMMINCAGLYSDKIADLSMEKTDIRIIPFRGEYYKIKKEKEYLVKNLIYPVPDPSFPFLGVHFTRMIGGGIEAGPNAVLAFRREGYKKSDIHIAELAETLTWPGFIKVAAKYWKTGFEEMYRSFSKKAFTKALQKLVPEIEESDLTAGGAGVRAQACDRKGGLADDFIIYQKDNIINVCNAPSPAATSSLSIGETLSKIALDHFNNL